MISLGPVKSKLVIAFHINSWNENRMGARKVFNGSAH